jgi:hypothetical protein
LHVSEQLRAVGEQLFVDVLEPFAESFGERTEESVGRRASSRDE